MHSLRSWPDLYFTTGCIFSSCVCDKSKSWILLWNAVKVHFFVSINSSTTSMYVFLQVSASSQVNVVSPWSQPITRICPLLCDPHHHYLSLMDTATALPPKILEAELLWWWGFPPAHGGAFNDLYRKLLLCRGILTIAFYRTTPKMTDQNTKGLYYYYYYYIIKLYIFYVCSSWNSSCNSSYSIGLNRFQVFLIIYFE